VTSARGKGVHLVTVIATLRTASLSTP